MSPERIVFLWGPARSMSTVFLRSFQRRDDTVGLFEPYSDCYYFSKDRVTDMYGDNPELWDKTGEAVETELRQIETDVLFVKEMAYFGERYVTDSIYRDSTHTFVVRDPRAALRSRKRVRKNEIGEYEFGFTALKSMWDRYRAAFDGPPVVVEGEFLRNHPESILRQYCDRVGLAFQSAMLSWEDGNVREWKPSEAEAHARFHKTLESSKGFIGAENFEYSEVTFDAREQQMIDRALEIYHEILPYAITPD